MLTSARRKISYPNPDRSDRPDVPLHIANLVAALELDVVFDVGVDSDRLAATHYVGGGRLWWATDTNIMWFDDGTAWHQYGNAPLDSPVFTGNPQAPTPPAGDNDTSIATTAFVNSFFPKGAVIDYAGGTAPTGWLMCDGSAVSRVVYSDLFAVISTNYGVGDGSTTFNLPDARGRVTVGKNAGTFNVLGKTGGEETHVLTTTEMPAHNHTETAVSAGTPAGSVNANAPFNTATESATHTHTYEKPNLTAAFNFTPGGDVACASTTPTPTGTESATHVHQVGGHTHPFVGTPLGTHSHVINNTGGGTAHNNLQPYITFNKIIKY